jgi:hypothetical protein
MTTLHDTVGIPYSSPDNKPAGSGTSITIHSSNGPVAGTMVGGYAVPNKY